MKCIVWRIAFIKFLFRRLYNPTRRTLMVLPCQIIDDSRSANLNINDNAQMSSSLHVFRHHLCWGLLVLRVITLPCSSPHLISLHLTSHHFDSLSTSLHFISRYFTSFHFTRRRQFIGLHFSSRHFTSLRSGRPKDSSSRRCRIYWLQASLSRRL